MAQWIRPRTLNREVPGSNLLAAAVYSDLGQGTLSSLPIVPRKGQKAVRVPWLLASKAVKIKSIPITWNNPLVACFQ